MKLDLFEGLEAIKLGTPDEGKTTQALISISRALLSDRLTSSLNQLEKQEERYNTLRNYLAQFFSIVILPEYIRKRLSIEDIARTMMKIMTEQEGPETSQKNIVEKETITEQKTVKPKKPRSEYHSKYKLKSIDNHYSSNGMLATISNPLFQNAFTFCVSGKAHLTFNNLAIKDGELFFVTKDDESKEIQFAKVELASVYDTTAYKDLKDNEKKEGIKKRVSLKDVDLRLLRAIYAKYWLSYIYAVEHNEPIPEHISVYLYDFGREMLGWQGSIGSDTVDSLKTNLESFGQVKGVFYPKDNDPKYAKEYALCSMGYIDYNTYEMTFHCDYLKAIADALYEANKKIKNGVIQTNKKGIALLEKQNAAHHYHNYRNLYNAKDRIAVDIVNYVGNIIVQAGKFTPNVSFQRIIDTILQLKKGLAEEKNKTTYLKRHFRNAWKYLAEYTDFGKYYELPDPNKPQYIPTVKTLDTVITFLHL